MIATAIGHDDVVKCVRWVPSPNVPPSGPRALVSGSGDGTICIWLISTTPEQPWSLAARLAAHTAPVTSAALHCSDASGALLLVSTGGDGDVVIWQASSASADSLSQDAWRQVQRLSFGTRLQHCAALCTLPSNSSCCMLALGGVDGQVRIFCREEENTEFRAACNLTGHQNWVRGLALAPRGQGLLLASASQDRYIRLWSIAPEQAEEQQAQPLGTGEGAVQEQLMRYAPRPKFRLQGGAFSATLHALLVGHEDWVHSVAWRPAGSGSRDGGTGGKDELCLLSASMDRTMMIWVPDEKTGELRCWRVHRDVKEMGRIFVPPTFAALNAFVWRCVVRSSMRLPQWRTLSKTAPQQRALPVCYLEAWLPSQLAF